MSFHGGNGNNYSQYFFCKKNQDEVFEYLDVVALVSPIGIFLVD